jgi:hypothetical protein
MECGESPLFFSAERALGFRKAKFNGYAEFKLRRTLNRPSFQPSFQLSGGGTGGGWRSASADAFSIISSTRSCVCVRA